MVLPGGIYYGPPVVVTKIMYFALLSFSATTPLLHGCEEIVGSTRQQAAAAVCSGHAQQPSLCHVRPRGVMCSLVCVFFGLWYLLSFPPVFYQSSFDSSVFLIIVSFRALHYWGFFRVSYIILACRVSTFSAGFWLFRCFSVFLCFRSCGLCFLFSIHFSGFLMFCARPLLLLLLFFCVGVSYPVHRSCPALFNGVYPLQPRILATASRHRQQSLRFLMQQVVPLLPSTCAGWSSARCTLVRIAPEK